MSLDLINTLRDLVAIASVNPMAGRDAGPEFYEYRLTDYLQSLFSGWQIPVLRQPIAPRRDNLIACIHGDPLPAHGGAVVLLEAHQDTVPVIGMTIAPFEPEIRDGRLFGRGACDIKGGMTAMLATMARLAEERPTPRPTVLMACTVNEEYGFTGAAGLAHLWSDPSQAIFPRRPDAVIVAEPTSLNVVVAHKGTLRWRLHTRGRAAHSSMPTRGENAIFRMGRVLASLERYQTQVVAGLAEHPLCGRSTLSVGTITGGVSVNTIPDRSTIEIDRRLVPGEDLQAAWQHVVDYVASETGLAEHLQHDPPYLKSVGLNDARNQPLAKKLVAATKVVTNRDCQAIGVPFGTNAVCYDAAGAPTVVFGPGSIDQWHTADEWVPLAEVEQAAEILYQLITSW